MSAMIDTLKGIFRRRAPEPQPGRALLERKIGYRFQNADLMHEALVHRSTLGERRHGESSVTYERLEFLGDAVLALVTSDFLLHSFPEEDEGQLTKKKSLLVSKGVLSKKSEQLGLKEHLILSESALKGGVADQESVLTAVLEAIIGAIYLDGGLPSAKTFIEDCVLDDFDDYLENRDHINYKSVLQEYSQSRYHSYPRYGVRSTTGPEHDKIFLVEVKVGGKVAGRGRGKSKKDAEQMAAKEALHVLRKHH